MNILFIYPDISDYALFKGSFYTGIAYLSAVLKRDTPCSVSLMHLTKSIKREIFLEQVENYKPDLIAFSSTTNMYFYVQRWAKWIKSKHKDLKIICGGVHPTISPEEVIQNPDIDGVCVGEGEETIVEFCNRLNEGRNIDRIDGLWVKDNGRIYKNRIRPLLQNLDSLPFPDRAIFDYPNLHSESEGCATVMVSRGCPFLCSYCCNAVLRKIYNNSKGYVRFRSVDKTIFELKKILQDFPFIKRFNFDDDILPLKREWFIDFTYRYRKEISLPYSCNLQPLLATEEVVRLLAESGCKQVRMGVETGNESLRKKVLNRNISNSQIIRAFKLCKEYGIETFSFNMVGLPYEDIRSMLETIKLNAQIDTTRNQVTIFYPYPKTKIYDICLKENLINFDKKVFDYSTDTILNFKQDKKIQIIFIQKYFRILVRLYQLIYKLPVRISRQTEIIFDKLLQLKITTLFIMPIMKIFAERVIKNRFLAFGARKFYRKLFCQ